MSEISVYILLFGIIGVLWLREIILSRKEVCLEQNSMYEDSFYDDADDGNSMHNPSFFNSHELFDRTIKLLGYGKFEKMTNNLHKLVEAHEKYGYTIFSLNEGALDSKGGSVLHHLLPGDPVNFIRSDRGEAFNFDFFSSGSYIGSLSNEDSLILALLISRFRCKGIYVWEQNCYGNCKFTDMEIIVYCDTEDVKGPLWDSLFLEPYKLKIKGKQEYILIQN